MVYKDNDSKLRSYVANFCSYLYNFSLMGVISKVSSIVFVDDVGSSLLPAYREVNRPHIKLVNMYGMV